MATTATETTTEAEPGVTTEVGLVPHRITVDRFEKMIKSGVFGEDDRIFLWHGRLVEGMAPGIPHSIVVTIIQSLLARMLADGWFCFQEQPIAFGGDSMPQPDLAIVRGTFDDYRLRRATSSDLGLILEVSDTSVAIDSKEKLETYASHNVPVYWIVDIPHRRIEVCSGPTGPAEPATYRERKTYNRGEVVPIVLDGREVGRVAVDAIFPGDRA